MTTSPKGFKDGTNSGNDYSYDQDGNMIQDKNKNITNIKYNHLNLPTEIQFTNNRGIEYTYDATGIKLKKLVYDDTDHTSTDYINRYQYKNNKLEFFPTAEGYVKVIHDDGNLDYTYVYNYTDHLGNIRMSYVEGDNSITNYHLIKIDETHYYPFGLKHGNYNTTKKELKFTVSNAFNPNNKVKSEYADKNKISENTTEVAYKYKYNGKELQHEFDLNWYAMDVRSYDPAIARWTSMDPVTHYSMSPYNSFDNNPVYWADPSGANSIYNFDTGQYVINGQEVSQQEAITYAENGGNSDGNNNNTVDDKIINPDKDELEKIALDFNTIFNRKFGKTPFTVEAEERGEGENKRTVYVLKGSVGFD